MKTTIANLSAERLEQEIANIYMTAAKENPPIQVQETEGSLIEMLWGEFDYRYQEGTVSRDTDWTERQDWE